MSGDDADLDLGIGPFAQFQGYLTAGRFMIQRSRSTGEYTFYPRTLLPGLGLEDLEWVPASGNGHVYATTTLRRALDRGGDFNISIVQLEEGPRVTTRIVDVEPDKVRIGMPVLARIEQASWRGDKPGADVLVFYPKSRHGASA
jgi:uncharacterized OB-fold protein